MPRRRNLLEEFRDVLEHRPDLVPFRVVRRPINNDRAGGELAIEVAVEVEVGGQREICSQRYVDGGHRCNDGRLPYGTIDAYHLALRGALLKVLPSIHPQLNIGEVRVVNLSKIAVSGFGDDGRVTARQISMTARFRQDNGRREEEWPISVTGDDFVDAACRCLTDGYQFWAWRRVQQLTGRNLRLG